MAQELEGVADAYKPPAADYDIQETAVGTAALYMVSVTKLVILYVATFGLYGVYWFYKHWALQRQANRLEIWPIARGIFAIFFVHRLFKVIDISARETGVSPAWDPGVQATIYVVLAIGSRLLERFDSLPSGGGMVLSLISIGLALSSLFPLCAAQQVANAASGDPEARANSKLTGGNIVVMLFGLVLWALIIVGLAVPETPDSSGF